MRPFAAIAHRGASGYEPENTMAAFEKAVALGADMIEIDVHRCASGELVVIHDETVDRTTNGAGHVSELSYAELSALDAGKGERVPLLNEVVERIGRRAPINIELKGPDTGPGTLGLIKSWLERGFSAEDFLVSSFNHLDLWKMKNDLGSLRVAPLAHVVPDGFAAFARELGAWAVNVEKTGATPALAAELHRLEIKLFVYTVDTEEEIGRMRAIGADGVFTDFPDRIPY